MTKALEFANYRVTLNNQQAQLKAKTQSLLSYSINGGTFTIDILITFCKQLIEQGQTEVVIPDIYKNPIKIEVESFYEEISSDIMKLQTITILNMKNCVRLEKYTKY